MSILSDIRKRSGIVIGGLVLALLGFILTDVLSNNSLLRGEAGGPRYIAKIHGEEIRPEDFDQQYRRLMEVQLRQAEAQGKEAEVTAEMEESTRKQVWENILSERTLGRELDLMDMRVTGEEVYVLAASPLAHPVAQQYFLPNFMDEQTQQINYQQAASFIANMGSQPAQNQLFWHQFENELVSQREREKYNKLVAKVVFATDLEAEDDWNNRNQTVSLQFVPMLHTNIHDTTIEVTDAELRDYLKENEPRFKREADRTVEYVAFDLQASPADTAAAFSWISRQKEALAATKRDTSVLRRLDKSFDNTHKPRDAYPEILRDSIFAADSGDIIGPFYEGGRYIMAKVLGSKADTVYHYRASHILLQPAGATTADTADALRRANNLLATIRREGNFEQYARDSGTDGTAMRGGDLGWFKDGAMVAPFMEAVKRTPKGGMTVVETQFGAHVIKVTETPTNRLVKAGVVERKIEPGQATLSQATRQASAIYEAVLAGRDFDEVLEEKGLYKRVASHITPEGSHVVGLPPSRELVRWAYHPDREPGDISEPMRLENMVVVAKLTKVSERGIPNFENIREELTQGVRMRKKNEMLMEQMRKAAEGKTSLEAIATATNSNVLSADAVNFANPSLPNFVNEPGLVGRAFGTQPGQLRGPVPGRTAVFCYQVGEVQTGPVPQDWAAERRQMVTNMSARMEGAVSNALRDLAKIEDLRHVWF